MERADRHHRLDDAGAEPGILLLELRQQVRMGADGELLSHLCPRRLRLREPLRRCRDIAVELVRGLFQHCAFQPPAIHHVAHDRLLFQHAREGVGTDACRRIVGARADERLIDFYIIARSDPLPLLNSVAQRRATILQLLEIAPGLRKGFVMLIDACAEFGDAVDFGLISAA